MTDIVLSLYRGFTDTLNLLCRESSFKTLSEYLWHSTNCEGDRETRVISVCSSDGRFPDAHCEGLWIHFAARTGQLEAHDSVGRRFAQRGDANVSRPIGGGDRGQLLPGLVRVGAMLLSVRLGSFGRDRGPIVLFLFVVGFRASDSGEDDARILLRCAQ